MKSKIYSLLVILLLYSADLYAQSGLTGFNYQTIIRNPSGTPLANQTVTMRFSILSGSGAGMVEYAETQSLTTNQFGLVR